MSCMTCDDEGAFACPECSPSYIIERNIPFDAPKVTGRIPPVQPEIPEWEKDMNASIQLQYPIEELRTCVRALTEEVNRLRERVRKLEDR